MRDLLRLSVLQLACCALCIAPAAAQEGVMGVQTGDLRIHTDSTDYNINTGNFTMPHHVSATRPGTQIDGDRAHGNGKKRIVVIEGRVSVRQTGRPGGGAGLLGSTKNGEPSTLTTDSLTVELSQKVYTAEGHVVFTQGQRTVTADHGVLRDQTHDLHLTGNVHVNDAEQALSADTVDYNTRTEEVHARDNVRITVPVQQANGPLGEPVQATGKPPQKRNHR